MIVDNCPKKTLLEDLGTVHTGLTVDTNVRPILGSHWLGEFFSPGLYLVTLFIGFSVCCIFGHFVGTTNQFGNIPRFGITLGPQVSFYPTIRQLLSFAQTDADRGKVIVIVGGSSILNGVGQSAEQLWTRKLQANLGEKFKVVNLGLRSCSAYEGAYFVAEALHKKAAKVILVTGSAPCEVWNPLGLPTYAHLYWDAKFHNLLYNFSARDAAITSREKELPDDNWTVDSLNELKLSRAFNSVFHFLDFWNTIGFRYFYTLITPINQAAPFAPLKRLSEIEGYENFPAPDHRIAMDSVRGASSTLYRWDSSSGKWLQKDGAWKKFSDTIDENVVPQMRQNTLVLFLYHNPFYRDQLTGLERKRDQLAYGNAQAIVRSKGMESLQSCDNFEPCDFRDTKHLAATGGVKLAIQVAEKVREMSKKLGYE